MVVFIAFITINKTYLGFIDIFNMVKQKLILQKEKNE